MYGDQMRFYEYRARPLAETAGHFIAWLNPGRDWTEIPALPKGAKELTPCEWRRRFRGTGYWATTESVEEACTHFGLNEALERIAAKRRIDSPPLAPK
jgi:hypothetical protein